MLRTRFASLFCAMLCLPVVSLADRPPPIIDVHLHAVPVDSQGPPPATVCAPFRRFPVSDPRENYGATFATLADNPDCLNPIRSPTTNDELMERTLAILETRNIIGITSGPPELVEKWHQAASERVIPGLIFDLAKDRPSPETLR
ncbi:MAG: amidohydrolase, partial [Pseudomonadales bacterium]|nr:amidohydrolase [Pseudomonadales bacterium]